MSTQKWKYVNIPEAMWKQIEKLIKENPELGYKSVADFVTSAVRAQIDYRSNLSELRREVQALRQES